MNITGQIEGLQEALTKLDLADNLVRDHLRRGLYRISHLWKRKAVEYAPISPSTGLLRKFAKQQKAGGEHANTVYVAGRKGQSGIAVKLTTFYDVRLKMLIRGPSGSRPTPGGLMRSIQARSTGETAEVFVPSNSVAGTYAFKIHEERGSKWKDLGPGSQAKGSQAREKFITRAASDQAGDFTAIINDELNKAIGAANK